MMLILLNNKFLHVSKILEIFTSIRKSSKFLQVSENPRNFYKYQKILEIFTSIRKSVKFLQVSENVCNREMCATEGKYLLLV